VLLTPGLPRQLTVACAAVVVPFPQSGAARVRWRTLSVNQLIKVMNTIDGNLAAGSTQSQQQESVAAVNKSILESLSKPVGTFAGITDGILRIRDGRPTAMDTGDQGGGQN
jgi:hypothetical protein